MSIAILDARKKKTHFNTQIEPNFQYSNIRLQRTNERYFEPASGNRPTWKRFEPSLDVLKEAIDDLQTITRSIRNVNIGPSDNKILKRSVDGVRVNKRKLFSLFGQTPSHFYQSFQRKNNFCSPTEPVKNRLFLCAICKDDPDRRSSPFFREVNMVYAHWLKEHKDGPTTSDDPQPPPFLFYVVDRMGCYHCEFYGIYSSLIHHHREKHRENDEPLVLRSATNRAECGICHGIEHIDFGTMVEHFAADHSYLLQFYLVDPVEWSVHNLDGFLAINIRETPMQGACAVIKRSPDYLICYCDESPKIAPASFLQHCAQHVSFVKCSSCRRELKSIMGWKEHERIEHGRDISGLVEKMKQRMKMDYRRVRFVFSNGLVAMAQNLTEAMKNAQDEFNAFVDGLFDGAISMDIGA